MLFNKNPFHFYFLSVVYFYYVILVENSSSVILISLISWSWECKEMQFESYTFQQPLPQLKISYIPYFSKFIKKKSTAWNQCKPSRHFTHDFPNLYEHKRTKFTVDVLKEILIFHSRKSFRFRMTWGASILMFIFKWTIRLTFQCSLVIHDYWYWEYDFH